MGTESRSSSECNGKARDAVGAPSKRARAASAPGDIEEQIERDPSLVPFGPSKELVAPVVLEPAEVDALLSNVSPLLNGIYSKNLRACVRS